MNGALLVFFLAALLGLSLIILLLALKRAKLAAQLRELREYSELAQSKLRGLEEGLEAARSECIEAESQADAGIDLDKERLRTLMRVRGAINSLSEESSSADAKSLDLASSAMGLNAFADMQSDSIREVSSAIVQMDAQVKSVAKLAQTRRDRALSLGSVVRTGGEKISTTNNRMQLTARDLSKIEQIAAIIDDIAQQTSLLAMNAAIEAAHAGQYGRGFSVIAGEIKKLSEKTALNARGIGESISVISERVSQAVTASDESAQSFQAVSDSVTDFVSALDEISSSMRELATASTEILNSTTQISAVTESIKENARSFQEGSSKVEESFCSLDRMIAHAKSAADEAALAYALESGSGMIESEASDSSGDDPLSALTAAIPPPSRPKAAGEKSIDEILSAEEEISLEDLL